MAPRGLLRGAYGTLEPLEAKLLVTLHAGAVWCARQTGLPVTWAEVTQVMVFVPLVPPLRTSTTFCGSVSVLEHSGRLGISVCWSTLQSWIVSSRLETSRHTLFRRCVHTEWLLCNVGLTLSRARTPPSFR
eukprot:4421752-Amphidinium_carterae.1